MTSYIAVIQDLKLTATLCRKVSSLTTGEVQTTCYHCGNSIMHQTSRDKIDAVFCNDECFENGRASIFPKMPEIKVSPVETANQTSSGKPKHCPECGGPSTRGRGWAHEEGCKNSAAAKLAEAAKEKREARENCPDCDGEPGKRRGWKHKPTCSRIAKTVSEPCPDCGGPKRGRGFTHNEDCPRLTNAE